MSTCYLWRFFIVTENINKFSRVSDFLKVFVESHINYGHSLKGGTESLKEKCNSLNHSANSLIEYDESLNHHANNLSRKSVKNIKKETIYLILKRE